MADLFDNPLGLDGFEFVEFSAPEKGMLEPVSYTHLDVYKRQGLPPLTPIWRAIMPISTLRRTCLLYTSRCV